MVGIVSVVNVLGSVLQHVPSPNPADRMAILPATLMM
jgi:hypothetical protein